MASSDPLKECPSTSPTKEPPAPVAHPRDNGDAVPSPQIILDRLAGKPQVSARAASPSLQRYLVNPSPHEMRALRLAASASLPRGTSTAPESPKRALLPGGRPIAPGRDMLPKHGEVPALPLQAIPEGAIEADPSISLSPSPPACPPPEYDPKAYPELLGLASKRYVSTQIALFLSVDLAVTNLRGTPRAKTPRRVRRVMRKRKVKAGHKNGKNGKEDKGC